MRTPRLVRTLFFTLVVIDLCLLLLLWVQPVHGAWLGDAAAGEQTPAPELFGPGVISTPEDETAASLSPDGRTLLFSRAGAIWESRLENGQWSVPAVAGFSGGLKDYYPSFSPDGARVFFTSSRPASSPDSRAPLGIWVVTKLAGGWGEREELGPAVNAPDREGAVYCSAAADGTLFFGLGKPGVRHILFARLVGGEYAPAEDPGPSINTKAFQGYHAISPDGRFLIFTSNRPGGLGGMDLYVSFHENGAWTEPRNLGAPVNSEADDTHASVSADGRFLFFTSNRTSLGPDQKTRLSSELKEKLDAILGGNRNIYRVELDSLNLAAR